MFIIHWEEKRYKKSGEDVAACLSIEEFLDIEFDALCQG